VRCSAQRACGELPCGEILLMPRTTSARLYGSSC
jgi:hypothetical protein